MPGPFPGMDPYLEDRALWPGVHDRLIIYMGDTLQLLLQPRYFVEIRERIYFEDPREVLYPDATIHRREPQHPSGGTATLVADEPVILEVDPRQREIFLEIVAAGSPGVVTVIEIISPANTHTGGRGRMEYRDKQDQVLASHAHLVEIDLLRAGAPVVMAPPGVLSIVRPFDYLVCVNRAEARRRVEVYPATVRERLPRPRVPLRAPDPDVVLDLPAIFDRCYENGGYAYRVDYSNPPSDPLSPAAEAWADEMLRQAGLRG